ncbi:MAG: DUF748 domain-containing protein [Opitutae bacterium]|nr:DUF748 domain-containing protein [Opitutae bacterium]
MTPRARARQRRRRLLLAALAVFAAGSLFAFVGLPPLLKARAEKELTALLHRPVTIGRVRVNPYTLALAVEQFDVRERDGRTSFLGWDRLSVNFEALSFVTGEWRFGAIELAGPHARVLVNKDGSLNFSDLLSATAPEKPSASAAPAKSMRPLHIDRFVLTGARLDFADESRAAPFATTFGPVGFSVTEFRTAGGDQAPYHFEAVTESGEKFAWRGWMEAAPFRSGGELSVSGLVLKKYAPYYAEKLGVDLADGRLTVRGSYEASFDEKRRKLQLLDGSVAVRNLKLVERGSGETLLEIPALDLAGATADGLTLKAGAKEVVLNGGRLRLRREQDGSLNLQKLVPPVPADAMPAPVAPVSLSASAAPAASPVAVAPAFALNVGELAVKDFAVEVQDLAVPHTAQLGVAQVNASLKNFTLTDGAPLPLDVSLNWQPKGTLHAAGTVTLRPFAADLQLQTDALALLPLSPYLEQFVNARLTDGQVSVKGRTTLALPAGQPPAATFDGEVWLEKLGLVDGARSEDLAGLSDLILRGLKLATAPKLTVALEEINLNAPYARVTVDRDGTLNLAAVAGAAKAPPASPAPAAPLSVSLPDTSAGAPAAAATGPDLSVGRVVINGGRLDFSDRSVSPQVRLTVTEFGGTLTEWSSANPGRGSAELKAFVDNLGPVAVAGRFDPLGKDIFVDTQVSLQRVDLQPFSPYVGKYAGYELARGKLFVDVKAKIAGRRVDLSNVITLDQFTFGAATNSPDATKLPVRLGVALLKDLDGKIVLDVPVQGSLDDPEFRIGRVVLRVVVNLLTKAAVSPFSLLGSMFGGGGDELGWQEFAPGESALTPDGLAKLGTLVQALNSRPGLNVDLEGSFDLAADGYALKHAKLTDKVRRTVWEARHAKDPNIAPPDKLDLAPEEFAAAVKKMFDRRFPPGTEFGTPLPPPPVIEPFTGTPPPNLLRRLIALVTFKETRERAAYKQQQKKTQEEFLKQARAAAAAGLPLEEMIGRLAEVTEVTPDDLRALAAARAQRVRDYLVTEGKIDEARLFLLQPKEPVAAEGTPPPAPVGKGPRVFLTLQ